MVQVINSHFWNWFSVLRFLKWVQRTVRKTDMKLLKNSLHPVDTPESNHTVNLVKTYPMESYPEYLKPLIETIIVNSDIFSDDLDTPENLTKFAFDILDTIGANKTLTDYILTTGEK